MFFYTWGGSNQSSYPALDGFFVTKGKTWIVQGDTISVV
jgi:hypothetical protein